MPEGLLGAQNTAVAEWKTAIFLTLFVVGHRESGGVPSYPGFCS